MSKKNLIWKTSLPGRGHSSAVHENGLIWITTAIETPASEKEKQERLKENDGLSTVTVLSEVSLRALQVDPKTGKIFQNIEVIRKKQPQWVHHLNSYASPSPVIEANRLYLHFGAYGNACLDSSSGEIIWKNNQKNFNNFISLLRFLSKKRIYQLLILSFIILLSGLSEISIVASLLPFLNVLNRPENVLDIKIIGDILFYLKITEPYLITFFVTFVFILSIISTTLLKLLNLRLNHQLSAYIGNDLSKKVFSSIIVQPYEFHNIKNSSSFITTITTHVEYTVNYVNMVLNLISATFSSFCLLFAIILINKSIAIFTILFLITIYVLLGIKSKKRMIEIGKLNAIDLNSQIKLVQETLGSIRDIILERSQKKFVDIFQKYDKPRRKRQAEAGFISFYPRYSIEAFALISLSTVAYILTIQGKGYSNIIISLGTFSLGSQRLLQSLQMVYTSWTSFKVWGANVEKVLEILNLNNNESHITSDNIKTLEFKKEICFDRVNFQYKESSNKVLEDISFSIRKGEKVGIVGITGSGKSTLVDLLMGLLEPSKGTIEIDGNNLHDNSNPDLIISWRSSISHVPQTIYLTDQTIAENIAFGIDKKNIDYELVKSCGEISQLNNFISELEDGFNTVIGERGVRLSGGQRQRIGLARALYKKSSILILDEATSALDTRTERKLMEAINNLDSKLTIIMIAHRESTLDKCNKIIKINKGRITEFT